MTEIQLFFTIGINNILNVRGITINKVEIYLILKVNIREINTMFQNNGILEKMD